MQPAEMVNEVKVLMLKIHVITGWEIPQAEMKTILLDQLCKKIAESYLLTNTDEIEYAFRNKPIEVKEWGKAMNLSLIDEVMMPYLHKRMEVSKLEEQKVIEYKPDLEQIEREYQEFLETPLGKKLIK